ncbi:5-oxoprolinase-like protein [Artemisia annua]|uniref:5-oxoprolinase-like protein n=1 Tax=Artemisia annua TaxID=35608 RepID=A0A2U1N548_ARTAN|nr:5-oxoprolinase-like protein [Artemisia annua]
MAPGLNYFDAKDTTLVSGLTVLFAAERIVGPTGGVVGYSQTLFGVETEKPLIGFDMGGTSTDVSQYAGSYEQVVETQIVGAIIQAPQLDIRTIAADSGSKLKFQFGTFRVGPESLWDHDGDVILEKFEVHTGSGSALAKLNGCAAASWMGCMSGLLRLQGPYNPTGAI